MAPRKTYLKACATNLKTSYRFAVTEASVPDGCTAVLGSYRMGVMVVAVTAFLFSCTGEFWRETPHPTAENVLDPSSFSFVVGTADTTSSNSRLMTIAEQLRHAQSSMTLDIAGGPVRAGAGPVEGLAVGASGTVYILDARRREVHRFDALGIPIPTKGVFATELRAPTGLTVGADDTLVIADRGKRVTTFALADGEYRSRPPIALDVVPDQVCTIDTTIYVRGYSASGLFHRYSLDGQHLGSFGSSYQSDNDLVRKQLSDGIVGCDPKAKSLVAMFKYLPYVYGYSSDGRIRWITKLETFHPPSVLEGVSTLGRRRVSYRPTEAFDTPLALVSLGTGHVTLQVGRLSRAGDKEHRELHTYVFDSTTGEGVYLGTVLPLIRGAEWPRVYALPNFLSPTVAVYTVAQGR